MPDLFHIVVVMPTRDEYPGARGEERIYTIFGWAAAQRKYRWLCERHPGCVEPPELQSREVRQPVCG